MTPFRVISERAGSIRVVGVGVALHLVEHAQLEVLVLEGVHQLVHEHEVVA